MPLAVAAAAAAVLVLLPAWSLGALIATSPPGSGLVGIFALSLPLLLTVVLVRHAFLGVAGALQAARALRGGAVLDARRPADVGRRHALTALGLAAATSVVLALISLFRVNDGAVATTFLRWDLMARSLGDVLSAFGVNVVIAIVAEILILVWALMLAVARLMQGPAAGPVRWLAIAYVDLFRSVPVIVVIYIVGFGLPLTGLPVLSGLSPIAYAILALTLSYGAYVSETYRSGIQSVHPSQVAAARSLGLTTVQSLRFVVLPQAVRRLSPALVTWFVALQKDTALVGIVGILDSFAQARFYSASDFNLSAVSAVSLVFVVVTIPQTRFADWLLNRSDRRMRVESQA